MRNFNQPKEFEYDDMNTHELFNANGLRTTYSNILAKTYVLKTDLYTMVITQMLHDWRLWSISIIESDYKSFTSTFSELPEFMQVFCEDNVRNFTNAEEVNYFIKKFLGLKVFL